MTEDEKRLLAGEMLPHLMWDLKRVETFKLYPRGLHEVGIARLNSAEMAAHSIKAKAANDNLEYTVLIIPTVKKLSSDSNISDGKE